MGKVIVPDVELYNAYDFMVFEQGLMPLGQTRNKIVDMIADTGAVAVGLPFSLINKLGLPKERDIKVILSDGSTQLRELYKYLLIKIGDRKSVFDCIAKPENAPMILGQMVFEALDYVVDCRNQRIQPNPAAPPGMMLYEDF